MANKDASFGLKPVKMIGGAPYNGGQSRYRIAANYGTSIFQGDLVMQVTGGGVEIHAVGGTVPLIGVFNGCSYTDPTSGEQVFSNYYPASTNASDIIANIIDDPMVVYEVQADEAFPVADLLGNFTSFLIISLMSVSLSFFKSCAFSISLNIFLFNLLLARASISLADIPVIAPSLSYILLAKSLIFPEVVSPVE